MLINGYSDNECIEISSFMKRGFNAHGTVEILDFLRALRRHKTSLPLHVTLKRLNKEWNDIWSKQPAVERPNFSDPETCKRFIELYRSHGIPAPEKIKEIAQGLVI